MVDDLAARVEANPKYHKLVSMRRRYSIIMTFFAMFFYYGYILLIAYNKPFLATKIGEGWTTSIGIPMGIGVILITIILTNIYVRHANAVFDPLNSEIIKEANQK